MLLSSSMLGSALAAQGLTVFSGPTEALAMQQHLSWASHTAQPKPFQYSLQVPPPNCSRCDQQQRHLWWRPAPSAATGGCPEGGRAGRVQAGPYSHRICAGRQVSLLGLPRPACIRTMATSQHHGVQYWCCSFAPICSANLAMPPLPCADWLVLGNISAPYHLLCDVSPSTI